MWRILFYPQPANGAPASEVFASTWYLTTPALSRRAFYHASPRIYRPSDLPEVNTAVLDDTCRFVGGLLLHHIQLVPYNAHEVAELRMKGLNNLDDSESLFVGAAIYPTLALFNHSCDPGIVRYVTKIGGWWEGGAVLQGSRR